jgi:hypothetical protein
VVSFFKRHGRSFIFLGRNGMKRQNVREHNGITS